MPSSRPRTLCRAMVAAALLIYWQSVAWSWETAHGRPDNTSFADVPTAPATTPRMIGNIGSIAPGAGPVVAPDGTVYIGNQQGKLMSFKPDGTPGWSRDLNRGEAILASPAIGSDGSIYVIGVRSYTDHRVEPSVKRADATRVYQLSLLKPACDFSHNCALFPAAYARSLLAAAWRSCISRFLWAGQSGST